MAGYDEILAGHARRLSAQFCGAVCRLAQLAPADEFLLPHLQRAAAFELANEAVMRALLRALDAPDALRVYGAFEANLRRNGGAPAPETQRLAREIGGYDMSTSERAARLKGDEFFGRESEMKSLLGDLNAFFGGATSGAHLLTLTGGGGYGKTHLAREVARRFEVARPNRSCFVPLAPLRDARYLADALVKSLKLPASTSGNLERVIEALRAKPTLLILDNFEHLIEGGAPIVRELLKAAPQTVCLATSRRLLGLPDEREMRVNALPVPAVFEDDVEALAQNTAVQMWLDRVQVRREDLCLTADNAGVVAQLCRELEGVPLAIELAAARGASLSPSQMLAALQERLKFLRLRAGESGDFNPRHHSVRATLSWSHDLLRPNAARLLRELSVFRGGWTLESARCARRRAPRRRFGWPKPTNN